MEEILPLYGRLESIFCDPWLTLHKIGATEKHTLHTFEVGAGRAAQLTLVFHIAGSVGSR